MKANFVNFILTTGDAPSSLQTQNSPHVFTHLRRVGRVHRDEVPQRPVRLERDRGRDDLRGGVWSVEGQELDQVRQGRSSEGEEKCPSLIEEYDICRLVMVVSLRVNPVGVPQRG